MTPKSFHFPQIEIRSISATVDRGLRFSVVTGEISDENRGIFLALQGINCEAIISPHEKEEGDEPVVVDSEVKKKSPSERLRSVLYVYFKQLNCKESFSDFYERQISLVIEKVKAKLDPP